MFKKSLAIFLSAAICALSLSSCGNIRKPAESPVTEGQIKSPDEFNVTVLCSDKTITPYLTLSSTNLPKKSAARAEEKSFDDIKEELPHISCATPDELQILVNGEDVAAEINLLNENGKECAYNGKGMYYVMVTLRFHGNTLLENGELFEETSYYCAYFKANIEPSGVDIIYSTAEPYHVSESDYEGKIYAFYYSADSSAIGKKTLTGSVAEDFAKKLSSLSVTGITSPAIVNKDFTVDCDLPQNLEDGLIWFDCDGKIYRISTQNMTVCRSDSYCGEGEMLYADIEFWNMLTVVNYYSPYTYNFYYGEYRDGKIEISNIYTAGSDVDIKLTSLSIAGQYLEKSKNNEVTFEITAENNVALRAEALTKLDSGQYGSRETEEITLISQVPKTVTLRYTCIYGNDFTLTIQAGNTQILLVFRFSAD